MGIWLGWALEEPLTAYQEVQLLRCTLTRLSTTREHRHPRPRLVLQPVAPSTPPLSTARPSAARCPFPLPPTVTLLPALAGTSLETISPMERLAILKAHRGH